ncbi:phage tail protein [Vibrio parahaemolyticus]|nr:phage tail protein [Vibrio parahaemolyticus]
MSLDLRTYVTNAGFALEAAAKEAGASVFGESVYFVIGDMELDASVDPTEVVDLNHQIKVYPATIEQDKTDPTVWVARAEIPAEEGGFYIREAGVRVDDPTNGTLYCYARQAGDYKPALSEGQGKSYTIRLQFIPGNAEVVEAVIDPTVQFVTPDDLDNAIAAIPEGFNAGQIWRHTSRLFNVTYTNENEYPIQLHINAEPVADTGLAAQLYIDDDYFSVGTYFPGADLNIDAIVPSGSSYHLKADESVFVLRSWSELY